MTGPSSQTDPTSQTGASGQAGASGHVVVGIDGSPTAGIALEWAADQARATRQHLTLVHALGPSVPATTTDDAAWLQRLHAGRQDHGREVLAEAVTRLEQSHPGLVVTPTLLQGDARAVLLESARSASVLVLGSRGLGPMRSLLLGSTSSAVVRHATCPVVVARPRGTTSAGVVVGTDATDASLTVLSFACEVCEARDLPLTVLHCLGREPGGPAGDVGPTESGYDEPRARLAEQLTDLARRHPTVDATLLLSREAVENRLVRASKDHELVVVGRRHLPVLEGLVMGSVAPVVVEHASGTVAVVPA